MIKGETEMHNNASDKLENYEPFIDWLKEHKCSDEIINGILEFDDEEFNQLKERIKAQPELLTAIVENGYSCEAIKGIFCNENDKIYNNFLQYKEFIVLLLENKYPTASIIYICDLVKYKSSPYATLDSFIGNFDRKGLFGHGHYNIVNSIVYFIFKYDCYSRMPNLSKFYDLIKHSAALKKVLDFVRHQDILTINQCNKNPELFYLVMKNGLIDKMRTLLRRSDYEIINVKNNKELLDFLLDKQLITIAQNKKDFIVNYPLVSSLLETGNLIISELIGCSLEEITKKVEMLARKKIVETDKALEKIAEDVDITHNRNDVQRLGTFTTVAVIKGSQKAPESLDEVKVTQEKAANQL